MDATPFANSVKKTNGDTGTDESKSLVDELGEMLRTCGFNYHGVEVLYSGVYGTELTCEIFIGPVYYQRLRHMVSDKFQVGIFFKIFLNNILEIRNKVFLVVNINKLHVAICRFAPLERWTKLPGSQ